MAFKQVILLALASVLVQGEDTWYAKWERCWVVSPLATAYDECIGGNNYFVKFLKCGMEKMNTVNEIGEYSGEQFTLSITDSGISDERKVEIVRAHSECEKSWDNENRSAFYACLLRTIHLKREEIVKMRHTPLIKNIRACVHEEKKHIPCYLKKFGAINGESYDVNVMNQAVDEAPISEEKKEALKTVYAECAEQWNAENPRRFIQCMFHKPMGILNWHDIRNMKKAGSKFTTYWEECSWQDLEKKMKTVDCVASKTGLYEGWEANDEVLMNGVDKFQVSDEFKNHSMHHFAQCSKALTRGRRDRFVHCFIGGLHSLEKECYMIVRREEHEKMEAMKKHHHRHHHKHHHHHHKSDEEPKDAEPQKDDTNNGRPRVINHKSEQKY